MSKTTPCDCCGLGFCQFELESEPCYGEIRPIEQKQYEGRGYIGVLFVHACEGHQRGGLYEPVDEE